MGRGFMTENGLRIAQKTGVMNCPTDAFRLSVRYVEQVNPVKHYRTPNNFF